MGDCTTHPAALTHNTAVHLLIHLSESSGVCVHAYMSACVCVTLPVCVLPRMDAYTLGEVSVPGQIVRE